VEIMAAERNKGGATPGTHEMPRVGAPDPELKTSPIFDEEEEELSFDAELEAAVCYYNGAAYPLGQYVLSGDEVLRCDRGVWVRRGERKP
jgi:hypothetical protein